MIFCGMPHFARRWRSGPSQKSAPTTRDGGVNPPPQEREKRYKTKSEPRGVTAWGRRRGDGRGDRCDVAGGNELAGGRVEAEGDDGVGVLVFGKEIGAGRVNSEVARFLAARGKVASETKCALFRLNRKDGDTVSAAVGSVKPFSIWMDDDLCRVVAAGKARGQRGNLLNSAKELAGVVVGEDRHSGLHFTQDIHEVAVAGKRHMAWSCAGAERRGECVVRLHRSDIHARGRCVFSSQCSLGGIEFVDQDAIEAQIRDIGKAIVRGEFDPVGVRTFLAFLVGAEISGVLKQRGMFAKSAVGEDWKDGDCAGGVVCDQSEFAGFVEGEIAGIFAERGKFIEERELSTLRIEGKSADHALLASFIHDVGEFSAGVNGHPRGIRRFGGEALGCQFAGFGVEVEGVDAFTLGFRGVGADESEVVMTRGARSRAFGEREEGDWRGQDEQSESAACNFHGGVV